MRRRRDDEDEELRQLVALGRLDESVLDVLDAPPESFLATPPGGLSVLGHLGNETADAEVIPIRRRRPNGEDS